jgi:dihydroneopterin aldolase
VAEVVGAGHVTLLEHLADLGRGAVLAADGRITSVTVWLRKLRPPVPEDLATSGVRITRDRA